MIGLTDIVLNDLKDSGADSETLELWKSITLWFEKGGPEFVEQEIAKKLRGIKSIASKQLKETKEAIPKKRKTRR